jgi:hypothetical protein
MLLPYYPEFCGSSFFRNVRTKVCLHRCTDSHPRRLQHFRLIHFGNHELRGGGLYFNYWLYLCDKIKSIEGNTCISHVTSRSKFEILAENTGNEDLGVPMTQMGE